MQDPNKGCIFVHCGQFVFAHAYMSDISYVNVCDVVSENMKFKSTHFIENMAYVLYFS